MEMLLDPLLIEVRRTDGSRKIIELEDPRDEWCRWFNRNPLNVAAGRSAHPVSSETLRANSNSFEA